MNSLILHNHALHHYARASIRTFAVTNLSDHPTLTKFTEDNKKSVLYYTATWCPPCKAIKPVYEKLSEDFEGIGFGKIDVDENAESAEAAGIRSVPTFVFSGGANISGADEASLRRELEKLNKSNP